MQGNDSAKPPAATLDAPLPPCHCGSFTAIFGGQKFLDELINGAPLQQCKFKM